MSRIQTESHVEERREEEEEDHIHYHGVDKAAEHVSVKDALDRFLSGIVPLNSEVVKLSESLGRVLNEDVRSKFNVPSLGRSTRDGFALKVTNHVVAAGSKFRIIGETRIGKKANKSVSEGESIAVATGSFLPHGSNSVVMKEYIHVDGNGSLLEITKDVREGENILSAGEDIQKNSVVLLHGATIKPHHVALLALVGVKRIRVFKRPRVAFFSTGDELIDFSKANKKNSSEKTVDINRPFISTMIRDLGGIPVDLGIARDHFKTIRNKIIRGLSFDSLILSAGSSVGERDFAAKAAESIKGVRTIVHGVAMRPSSPTALAKFNGKPFMMLPGFPTSMIVSFLVFARPAILKLSGSSSFLPPYIKATLENDFQGREGITNFLRLRVEERDGSYFARIVKPTEAQYSSWLREANGIGILDPSRSSIRAGETLNVFLIGDVLQRNMGKKE
jgi:molybdopterin molybdotransferase